MNKTFFTAAVLLVLVGCNDDKEQTKPAPGEGKITVTAGIDALTRAPHLGAPWWATSPRTATRSP